MQISELRSVLNSVSIERFVETQILGIVPWIFEDDHNAYARWRNRIALEAGVEPNCLYVVGSAATGFSLSPQKAGRMFRTLSVSGADRSDIDVAVASEDLFLRAWNSILLIDRGSRPSGLQGFRGKIRENVYWGHISEKAIPRNTSPSRQIRSMKTACTRESPFLGYSVSLRVYRRDVDLRGYQVWSVRKLRSTLNAEDFAR